MTTPRGPVWLALGLLAAGLLPALASPFAWDDLNVILNNPALERPIPLGRYLGPEYFSISNEITWRPLATAVYRFMTWLWGKEPFPMRLAGLCAHLANAALLGALLRRLGLTAAAAAIAAALFLAHPAHVETLMCVSFNEELLAGAGLLAAMIAHLSNRPALCALALAVALLSKESAAMGLPLLVLHDVLSGRDRNWKTLLRRHSAYAVAAGAVMSSWLWLDLPGLKESATPSWPDRLAMVVSGISAWLGIQLAPIELRLNYFALPPAGWEWAGALIPAAAGLGASAWLAVRLRRHPAAALLLAWPWLFWLLTSGLLPATVLSTRLTAERWLYLPLLGTCGLAGLALERRPRLALLLVALLGLLGALRARDWTDETRLWRGLARIYPWSSMAWEGLGEAHNRAGRHGPAAQALETALNLRLSKSDRVLAYYTGRSGGVLRWESPNLHRSLAISYLNLGLGAEAEKQLLRAVALDRRHPLTYRVMAYRAAAAGRFAEADDWLRRGLAQAPTDGFLLRLKPDVARRRLSFRAAFR